MIPKLFLVLAGHDPQAFRKVGILCGDVEDNKFVGVSV